MVMAATNVNEWDEGIAKIFDGYFLIKVSSTWYRYKRLTALNGSNGIGVSDHYGDDGKLELAPVSLNSTYSVTIEETARLFESTTTPSDIKSLSYIISQMFKMKLTPIEFEAVEETDASANQYIHNSFRGYITDTGHSRNTGAGTYERTLTIRVTELVEIIRNTDDDGA